MEYWLIISEIIGLSILLGIVIIVVIRYGMVILSKGYRFGVVVSLSFSYFLLAGYSEILVVKLLRQSSISEYTLYVPVTIFISAILPSIAYCILATRLPVLAIKRFGIRRVPWSLRFGLVISPLVLIAIIVVLVYMIFFPERLYGTVHWYDYFRFGVVFSVISWYSILLRKKMLFRKQKGIEDFANGPIDVLYLRSFYLDQITFAKAKISQKDQFGELIKYDSAIISAPVAFDEYFSTQIARQIGQFVCIGNPTNEVPREHINAVYPEPDDWEKYLYNFVKRARIILMQIGDSRFIEFEISTIIKTGNIQKLCLLTGPYLDNPNEKKSWKIKLSIWFQLDKKLNWNDTKIILERHGILIDFMPPAGSVIVFRHDLKAQLLRSGCLMPSEYVDAIKHYFLGPDK